jgi:hypothetical protein
VGRSAAGEVHAPRGALNREVNETNVIPGRP